MHTVEACAAAGVEAGRRLTSARLGIQPYGVMHKQELLGRLDHAVALGAQPKRRAAQVDAYHARVVMVFVFTADQVTIVVIGQCTFLRHGTGLDSSFPDIERNVCSSAPNARRAVNE